MMNLTPMPTGSHPPPWPILENRHHYLLRHGDKAGGPTGKSSSAPQGMPEEKITGAIVCRQCLHVITDSNERRMINGAHIHSFANPEGIIFEIGCYGEARGCGYVGPGSSEFTWFAGYVWRIALCGYCHVHLGWRFSGADDTFFHGLITSRLVIRDE